MTKDQKIDEFIVGWLELFGIDPYEFFDKSVLFDDLDCTEDAEDELCLLDDNGKISNGIVEHASRILGIDKQSIYNLDDAVLRKRFDNNPYFQLIGNYKIAEDGTYYDDNYPVEILLKAIYDVKITHKPRVDEKTLIHRLTEQLKELNPLMPGIYHENSGFAKICYSTSVFCSFKDIKIIAENYIQIINRAKELFFKALNGTTDNDEIHEYNFLVSVLGLRDIHYTNGYLYYEGLSQSQELYKDVSKDNFYNYFIFKHAESFQPWLCREFIEDEKLVQEYLYAFPQAKSLMRKASIDISCFNVQYIWSDDDHNPESWGEHAEYLHNLSNEFLIPEEEQYNLPHFAYLDKTEEELGYDKDRVAKIISYCRPEELGGLKTYKPVFNYGTESIKHIQALLDVVPYNNYFECLLHGPNTAGGSSNE